ncbi:hypothetical protein BSL82_04515 [Tardibacter chloracetimidivorans]|uniref:Luciferase-like domain-containing protein n=2 Tax=Tardibacter chloracetimidivorans TaxID=1921510 RepID=A0A1L3ZSQ1_9SPHN|nr:hypothetical protein BSL82_04515 [Tardibacter chloracetimidivorans]
MKVAMTTVGLRAWMASDIPAMIDEVKLAESVGLYQYDMPDHLVTVQQPVDYPYGKVAIELSHQPFYEPLTMLSALAASTSRIRLSTGILLAPFRPAVLLSKQISTLDHISRGRIDLGFGVGWMKEEFDACGVQYEGRFGYMIDQVRACRSLWTEAPASIDNKAAKFDEIFCFPHPYQKGGPRVILGIAPNARNFARMAEVADGWDCAPTESDPATLRTHIAELKQAFVERGRDPESILIRAYPPIVYDANDQADIRATLAQAPAFEDAGVDVMRINAVSFVRDENYPAFIEELAEAMN